LKCRNCNHLDIYHDDAGCKQASCGCIKTAKDLRGESRIPSFRSISNRTVWLVRFVIASIICDIISIAIQSYLTLSGEYNLQLDPILGVITTFTSIIPILAFIVHFFGTIEQAKIFIHLGPNRYGDQFCQLFGGSFRH
jgi:hypothetical protein